MVYKIVIVSFDTLGFNQLSVKIMTSYAVDSALTRSIFGVKLCMFRCMILNRFCKVASDAAKELLDNEIFSTESGPGFGSTSPL